MTNSHNPFTRSNFLRSYGVIFNITFKQMFWSKKTLFMSIVAVLPVFVAVLFRFSEHSVKDATEAFPYIILVMYLTFLLILFALFYGTAIVSDEVDNKTITYLFTRPIRKHSIILGKFAAYLLCVSLILIPSALLTFAIITTGSKMTYSIVANLSLFSRYLGAMVLALIAYGAVFTFFGAAFKHSVLIGLLFAFGWEKIVLIVPGLIKKFSIIHYLLSSFPHDRIPRQLIGDFFMGTTIRPVSSIVILLVISIAFLGLSISVFYHREYKI